MHRPETPLEQSDASFSLALQAHYRSASASFEFFGGGVGGNLAYARLVLNTMFEQTLAIKEEVENFDVIGLEAYTAKSQNEVNAKAERKNPSRCVVIHLYAQ